MAERMFNVYFTEIQNIKDSFDHDESVDDDMPSSVPDAGEEAAEFLNNIGVNINDVSLIDTENDWSAVVPVLTPKQQRTLRKRIETFKAAKRQPRGNIKDLFPVTSPIDVPGSHEELDYNTTDGAFMSRGRVEPSIEVKESVPMRTIYIPPPDYAISDEESDVTGHYLEDTETDNPSSGTVTEPWVTGTGHYIEDIETDNPSLGGDKQSDKMQVDDSTNSAKNKDAAQSFDLSGSLTRVDDLGKKDQKMLNALAHIELMTIFDEFNVKFSRRKAKQKVKEHAVFGVSIQTLLEKDRKKNPSLRVPLIFQQLIQHIELTGIHEEGLLRVSGRQGRIKELRQEWDSLYSRGKPISLENVAVHEAAGLLKLFLRELPAPLLTLEKVDAFMQVNKLPDVQKQLSVLNLLIILLPELNRDMLQLLLSFLMKVSDEPGNRMTAENVAMVMAPNLFLATSVGNYNKPEAMDRELMIAASTSKITLLLLTHFNALWMLCDSCQSAIVFKTLCVQSELPGVLKVPSSLVAQIRQKHESSQTTSALLKLLGSKEKSDSRSRYSTVSMLVPSNDVQINVIVERSGSDIKIPVDSTTTASDIVQIVARSPISQRKKRGASNETGVDHDFLFEVGGNIGERRLDPATNIMSVCQVNPNAKYVLRSQHQD